MVKRVWFVVSVIAALGAVVGALMMSGSVARPMVALVIVIGRMPVAMLLASTPDRRRTVGVLHVVAGALFGSTGFVLASQGNFLRLRMASIGWRILATSGHGLAPVGCVAIGVALALTGTGLLRSRRSLAVLSALLVILTSGYFAVSLAVAPYLYLRRRGAAPLDWQAVLVAIVLVLVALLQLIAALSRVPVTWTPTIPHRSVSPLALDDDAPHPHEITRYRAGRRWAKPFLWSAVGVASAAGISVWAWLIWGPRLVGPPVNSSGFQVQAVGSPR